jgi:hypothetical protein
MTTQQEFKRSSRFGLIGVFVVIGLSAAIALLFAQDTAHPTAALIAIFALIFGFVGVMMFLQRRDVDRAERKAKLEAVAPASAVTDPTEADQNSLLAALAVKPLDTGALNAATDRQWELVRSTMRPGPILIVLIACAVVPWELWQFKWSMIVFVPIILAYATYLAARTIMPGGTIDQAYDDSTPTIDALGLAETERIKVRVRRQPLGPQPFRKEIEGATAYAGERHGRQVTVRIDGGSTITLSGAVRKFEVNPKGERLHAGAGSPAEVAEILDPLRASSYWKGVSFEGGPSGIVVERKGHGGEHWMCDLWLAERLADAATPG